MLTASSRPVSPFYTWEIGQMKPLSTLTVGSGRGRQHHNGFQRRGRHVAQVMQPSAGSSIQTPAASISSSAVGPLPQGMIVYRSVV